MCPRGAPGFQVLGITSGAGSRPPVLTRHRPDDSRVTMGTQPTLSSSAKVDMWKCPFDIKLDIKKSGGGDALLDCGRRLAGSRFATRWIRDVSHAIRGRGRRRAVGAPPRKRKNVFSLEIMHVPFLPILCEDPKKSDTCRYVRLMSPPLDSPANFPGLPALWGPVRELRSFGRG